jgi:hypothetical protein
MSWLLYRQGKNPGTHWIRKSLFYYMQPSYNMMLMICRIYKLDREMKSRILQLAADGSMKINISSEKKIG